MSFFKHRGAGSGGGNATRLNTGGGGLGGSSLGGSSGSGGCVPCIDVQQQCQQVSNALSIIPRRVLHNECHPPADADDTEDCTLLPCANIGDVRFTRGSRFTIQEASDHASGMMRLLQATAICTADAPRPLPQHLAEIAIGARSQSLQACPEPAKAAMSPPVPVSVDYTDCAKSGMVHAGRDVWRRRR